MASPHSSAGITATANRDGLIRNTRQATPCISTTKTSDVTA
jgi:hypothetical protein